MGKRIGHKYNSFSFHLLPKKRKKEKRKKVWKAQQNSHSRRRKEQKDFRTHFRNSFSLHHKSYSRRKKWGLSALSMMYFYESGHLENSSQERKAKVCFQWPSTPIHFFQVTKMILLSIEEEERMQTLVWECWGEWLWKNFIDKFNLSYKWREGQSVCEGSFFFLFLLGSPSTWSWSMSRMDQECRYSEPLKFWAPFTTLNDCGGWGIRNSGSEQFIGWSGRMFILAKTFSRRVYGTGINEALSFWTFH